MSCGYVPRVLLFCVLCSHSRVLCSIGQFSYALLMFSAIFCQSHDGPPPSLCAVAGFVLCSTATFSMEILIIVMFALRIW